MVVLTTSETATSGVLAVLSDTTVTGRDVAAVLASLGEPCRHFLEGHKSESRESASHPHNVIRPPQDPSSSKFHQTTGMTTTDGEHESSGIQRGWSESEQQRTLTLRRAGVEGVYEAALSVHYDLASGGCQFVRVWTVVRRLDAQIWAEERQCFALVQSRRRAVCW